MAPETFSLTTASDETAGLTGIDLDVIAGRLDAFPPDAVGFAAKGGAWYVLPHNVEFANECGVPGEFLPPAINDNVRLVQAAGRTVVLFFDDGGAWNDFRPAALPPSPEPTTPNETEEMSATTKTKPAKSSKNGAPKTAKPVSKTDKALADAAAELAKTDPAAGKPAATKKEKAPKPPKKERAAPGAVFKIPAGVSQVLPLEMLTFDRRLQSRQSIFLEDTVEAYKMAYQDNPDMLPEIRAVDIGTEEADARKLKSQYVVWDGFQRGEARRRAGLKDIPVSIVPGTWDMALRLSIGANSDHGAPRTQADLRKAFQRLLDNQDMLDQVLSEGVGNGGANRALASAVGISKGLVSKILNSIGKTTRGDKIVNLPKRDDGTEPGDVGPVERGDDPSGGLRVESQEAIRSRATASLIREMQSSYTQLHRRYKVLLEREDARGLFRQIANDFGIPIRRDETPQTDAVTGAVSVAVTEYWPAVDTGLAMMDELVNQHAKMNTESTV